MARKKYDTAITVKMTFNDYDRLEKFRSIAAFATLSDVIRCFIRHCPQDQKFLEWLRKNQDKFEKTG